MAATDRYTEQRPRVAAPRIGLADLRKSHKLTQGAVADRIAAIIDKPFYSGSLSLIENGQRGASAEVLAALEQVFGLAPGSMAVEYEPSHDRRPRALAATGS